MSQQKEAGRFPAALVNHNVIVSKSKGTPGVEMVFRYEDEDGDEHMINSVVWLAEANLTTHLEMTQKTFDIFGFDVVGSQFDFTPWREENVEESEFVGTECSLVLEEEEYEKDGETKTAIRVRWINAPGGGQRTFNDAGGDDAIAKIKAMAGVSAPTRSKAGRSKASSKKKATTKKSTSKKATNTDADDDAPPF